MSARTLTSEQIEDVLAQIASACSVMIKACSDTIDDGSEADASDFASVARMAFRQIGVMADGLNGFDCRGSADKWIVGFDMPNRTATHGDAS